MKNYLPILILIVFVFALSQQIAFSQTSKGIIRGEVTATGIPVELANVGLLNTTLGAATDVNGKFEIKNIPLGSYELQVSALGYKKFSQKVRVNSTQPVELKIELEESFEEMEAVVVTGTMKEVSRMESPVPVEVYSPQYFKKNPVPALFESLQIVNGVRPQINCSVCNTGDIHINGMEGPYTMVLIDGMPIVGGLASTYGLNGIPNSMIERLEVVKGPASTLYGSEAVGGLINVITKAPYKAPVVAADVFVTDWQEVNTDLSVKAKMGKATAMVGLNYFNYENPIDNNGDNFTDVTQQDRIALFNKWTFDRKNGREASLMGRFIYEDRWGGEMQWGKHLHRGGDQVYGESIFTTRYELIGTYQLPIDSEKILFNFSFSDHDQDSRYGVTSYIGHERIVFGQLRWNKTFGKKHEVLMGLAARYTHYDDNTPATRIANDNAPSKVLLPGIFVQDEITVSEKHKLLLGARYDYHPEHRNIFSPRINWKWTPDPVNILRLSLGNGFRVVNLFTEEHAAVTGDREVVITEQLNPERSYNANLNYQRFIHTNWGLLSLDAMAFYTYFTNKIVADYESDDDLIIYDNLTGHAVSRGMTLNTDFNFNIPLKINVGVTLMDVFEAEKQADGSIRREQQLLTENYTGIFTVSYTFRKLGLTVDYSGNIYGPMKLPLLENDYRGEYSPWYSIQNIQLSKQFKNGIQLYGGVKNLLNFTPRADAIMRAHDPFDRQAEDPVTNPYGYTFDASYVYTSNQGIRGFLGMRYQLF
jgi:outer membrane receptor for ferrienterochelin and colicins